MNTEYQSLHGSSSCRAADAAAWDAVQQQKRQRCQGSSSNDQVGSSSNNFVQTSEPELQDSGYGENEEEDYYVEDEDEDECCYDDDDDDDDDGSEYEFDEADFNQQLADKFDDLDLPPGVEATVPWLQKVTADDGPGEFKSIAEIEDDITEKYKLFKQFDTVDDFPDHHFAKKSVGKTGREWARRIQHDWKLLEKDLPGSIYVRVSEDRMDLLRAVIVGPKETPYHDGLFFFDAQFPASYPAIPPSVHYHAGGLRLNPNLYACGKVCLSLLGTWSGSGCERWNPAQSTMLQVLISIQALVLNEKPYFNEPGYENYAKSITGEMSALEYNDATFLHSCRTMLYSLRRPPKHFEDFVAGHFRERGHIILAACKYYMEGHKVGSIVLEQEDDCEEKEDESTRGSSSSKSSSSCSTAKPSQNQSDIASNRSASFEPSLQQLFEELLMEFNVKGADTKKFIAEKLKKNQPAVPQPATRQLWTDAAVDGYADIFHH